MAACDLPAAWVAEYTARCVDDAKVYLTSSPDDAVIYAALWPDSWLYLVTPQGDLEPDPDLVRAGGYWVKHVRCSSAVILERQRLPEWIVDEAAPICSTGR